MKKYIWSTRKKPETIDYETEYDSVNEALSDAIDCGYEGKMIYIFEIVNSTKLVEKGKLELNIKLR